MSKFKTLAVVLPAAALATWLGYRFWHAYQPNVERLQGQIEAQQYNISSKVAGRIDQVLVRKGDKVSEGQLIFTLLSPEIDAKLEQAKASQQAAGALADEAQNGARAQEISAASDQWQKAKAASALAEKTYRRINNLYRDGVVAEQKRDEAYTQWQAARYTEQAAYQMFEMAKEGAREETKRAAQEKERMAAGAVAEVEAYAADTKISSWHDGEVSQILLHGGELAPQGFPVVSIIDMDDAWAVFHVREDRLADFAKGTQFEAKVPALGDQTIPFTVTHVAVMGDFATWRATDTQQGFDMRTFEVEARPLQPVDGLRVGMSVLVER
ncbi:MULTISPECIES: HlyD family secretion protein [Photobacterium]|uniref:Membrane protein n=1 Tax=Photobacterium halotolerans TaxID=265726 RepID=A0A0F5VCY4_9GAMM|nr:MULTISPECIES: efflux RND transporter periplasmic adaptor subunit [Photobacterium]KKC99641.1 membrane protein [Photobacterium halotolerans]UIP29941.1 efflux RND transporter periplasmic adaptor subunit [Photobacterium sp. TLY01]